jgi:hypothetical protein
MFIQQHNSETGEITQKELTTKEIKDRQDKFNDEAIKAEEKSTAKAALLTKLGITAEEAKLLLS